MTEKTEDNKGVAFDIKKLNQIYQKETGQEKQVAEEDARKMMTAIGGAPRALDLDDIADTFCEAWPKAKKFFKIAFGLAAWMPGVSSLVVMAKGVISAIDKVVVPVICGVQQSESMKASSPGSGGGAPGGGGNPSRPDPIHR